MQLETVLENILQEIKYIKSNMVTKEEAKNFLTKEDAKSFLTKEDAKNFLTKEDAKSFATKEDIRKIYEEIKEIKFVINGLAEDIGMLDQRTRSLVVYRK